MKEILFISIIFVSRTRCDRLNYELNDQQKSDIILEKENNFLKNNSYENINDTKENEGYEKWECSNDETEKLHSLMMTNEMIRKGEEEIKKHSRRIESTILVLGNAGSGKTTFVQFMAGDNSKLISKEVGSGSAHYLIEDGKKIGSSVSESFTLYPDQVTNDLNATSYTDTPGFSDTRSPKHELVAAHVMKMYLKNIKNIKIVILITYNSVEQGVYKNDFVDLLRNINAFVRNIDKYKDSIALIATKVPNMYKINKNNVTLVSDKTVLDGIAGYLTKLKISLNEKLLSSDESKEKIFLENSIKLIDAFQETDTNGNFKRISIFRRPSEAGILSEIPLLQQAKEFLRETVVNNIKYSELSENDVGYALSGSARNYLYCLLWYINDIVINISSYTYMLMENHYELQMANYTDVYQLYNYQNKIVKKLMALKNDLIICNSYKNYSTILKDFISNENIQLNALENTTYFEIEEYLNNIQQFTDIGPILTTVTWAEQMKNLLNFMKENLSWYSFLIKALEHFSSYKIQISKSELYNPTELYNTTDSVRTVLSNIDELLFENLDSHFSFMTLRGDRKLELDDLISLTIKSQTNISCDDGKITVKGYYVTLSSIKNNTLLKNYCGNTPIKMLIIYGLHTVFIDTDLTEEYFKGINIMIAAPVWEIIGKREINVDGIPGKTHNNTKAEDGKELGESGRDGLDGLSGGNGGNVFGIGSYFINEENLVINANGGKGGPGQHGGNGKVGSNGRHGFEKFNGQPGTNDYDELWDKGTSKFTLNYTSNEVVSKLTTMSSSRCYGKIKVYSHDGDCGDDGGQGGYGGAGGIGGNPGSIFLLGENDPPQFSTQNYQGGSGEAGVRGIDGLKGEDGLPFTCFQTLIQFNSLTSVWRCTNLTYHGNVCPLKIDMVKSTSKGTKNFTSNITLPTRTQVYDFSSELHDYTLLLKTSKKNRFLSNITNSFLNHIYTKLLTMKNQFWKFIILNETLSSVLDEVPQTVLF
ncbi:uncharacterized protein LOC142330232 [Lycorma delicatula]|uniref:uncharacterized protein LOC142330232 n=1 Tax=Lycorma delicatula TaxID=130591 RepID=UPI003F510B79